MTNAAFKDEAQLQAMLWAAIEDEKLADIIEDPGGMGLYLQRQEQEHMFPQFSIDHLVRNACLKAGCEVLTSLNMLVPLTGDKNVSFVPGEWMRPDIVCINPELECVVIFELKKTEQTGRQAVTELLAYEQEIKNLLPFLSNYDVHLVLVSPEWSTLMDHAVASAVAWSGRKILCLDAGLKDGALQLATRVPAAWTITGSVWFPSDALPSVTICLYEKDANSPENIGKDEIDEVEDLDPRVWTALEVIAREGDRMGGHGFALLWRDHFGKSLTSYNITVVGVAPFQFYKAARQKQNIGDGANKLVSKLDEYVTDYDPQGYSAALMATATVAYPLLEEVADPSLENFSNWATDALSLRERAEPLLCEFWGELGAHARKHVLNPAVRKHRRNTLVNGTGDWRHPSVGLPLIASFTRPEIFADGDVRCSDAFRLGVLFGLDRITRLSLRNGVQSKQLECLFQWNRIELMAAIDEVRLLADAAENVAPPAEPLRFYEDPLIDDNADHDRAMKWLMEEFLQKSAFHIGSFVIGVNGALLFDNERKGLAKAKPPQEKIDKIRDQLRLHTRGMLMLYRKLAKEDSPPERVHNAARNLLQGLGLKPDFTAETFEQLPDTTILGVWQLVLDATDALNPNVFYRHSPVAPSMIDWEWLRQGVVEMRARGITDAGVMLLPNGQLVTGPVLPEDAKFIQMACDPKEQVYFMDRSHGMGVLSVRTWAELEEILAKKADQPALASDP